MTAHAHRRVLPANAQAPSVAQFMKPDTNMNPLNLQARTENTDAVAAEGAEEAE